ncbi:ThuA domain-containing protein [Polaribacter sp. SA4-12]|uniref:ThuA domain-containing protein n=1 Tax=Polaribacter sp. SA4-12 TaxID=1312072 RepID=UPI001E28385C|nr:ThuA domain-containing protein [Polaribacter sp. SA4-12]
MQKKIKKVLLFSIFSISIIFISCKSKQVNNTVSKSSNKIENTILVFSKTNGWRHKSIPAGITAIKKLGLENNWKIETTEDSNQFNDENLKNYKNIIFLNTTGDILNSQQEKAFIKYINEGGSFVGLHSASDTEHKWPFYSEMIGAQFKSHPEQQTAVIKVHKENKHPSIAHYGNTFQKFDEWYNFKEPVQSHVNVLLELDENSYKGKRMGTKHDIAWYHHYEGGRIFYTGMGHADDTFADSDFLQHLKEGISWALGETNVQLDKEGENLLDNNLSKWDVWMGAVHPSVDVDFEKSENVKTGKPMGLNNDPKKVFSVIKENGEDVLKITGEIYGGLTTKNEYGDYHFTAQFKWGEKKWKPRLQDKRDSGILYHAKGIHGAFWNVWMSSLEFQVQEGDCGDFIALGDVYGDVPSDRIKNKEGQFNKFVYNPKGKEAPLKWAGGFESGQASKSKLNENSNGEWNTLEIYCLGNESIHLVNGVIVNRIKNARYDIGGKTIPVTQGKIQIQSEAAEVYYKNIKITPISNFPKSLKNL